jgi:hypothetical protein
MTSLIRVHFIYLVQRALFRFRFYSSHCIYRRRMRTYMHTAFIVLDREDILYGGHKSDAGVGVDFPIDMDFASSQRYEMRS